MKIEKNKLRLLTLILAIAFFLTLCIDNFLPSTPFIAKSFHISVELIEQSFLLVFAGMSIGLLIAGILLITSRRKIICSISILIVIAGELMSGFSSGNNSFMLSRFIAGLGIVLTGNALLSILTDYLTREEFIQVNAIFMLMYAIMPIISPMTGGYVQTTLGWRYNFLIPLLMLAILLVVFSLSYRETYKKPKRKTSLKLMTYRYFYPIKNKNFMMTILVSILITTTFYIYIAIGPQLFEVHFNLSPISYASLAVFYAIAFISSSTLNSIFISKFGLKKIMFYGSIIGVIGILLFCFMNTSGNSSILKIIVPICIYFFGISFVFDNALPFGLEISKIRKGNPAVLFTFLNSVFPTCISLFILHAFNINIFTVSILFGIGVLLSFGVLTKLIFLK